MCRAGLSMGEAWRKPARAYRLIIPAALFYTKREAIAQRQSLPFLFGIHFLISAVSTMNFTLPVLPAGRPEKVW